MLVIVFTLEKMRKNLDKPGRIDWGKYEKILRQDADFRLAQAVKQLTITVDQVVTKTNKNLAKKLGEHESAIRKAAIAEKFAERAFTMASTANLGVIALQKSLATPKLLTKQQVQRNQLAKNEVDKLFTTEGEYDFLRTILSDEDNEVLDRLEEHKLKTQNGSQ